MTIDDFTAMQILLVAGLVFSAACISPGSPGDTGFFSKQPDGMGTLVPTAPPGAPIASPFPTPPGTTTKNVSAQPEVTGSPVTTPTIPKSYGRDAADEPQIILLKFVRNGVAYDIPDCGMRVAFPQAAADPDYGIRKKTKKLVLVTPEEIEAFEKTYAVYPGQFGDTERHVDPGTIGGARCAGVPANPVWNFIRVNATFIPRNARPGEYDIGINLRYHGEVVEQVRMNQTFVLDQTVVFIRYIPLKVDEMDLFDNIELVFSRRA